MYAPVHHGNNPVLYSNYMFKGKRRNRPFITKGFITKDQAKEGLSKAMKVGVPLIGKLIKGVSKQQRRKKRSSRRKLRKLKGGSLPLLGGPFGKLMALTTGLIKTVDKKVAA